MTSHARIGRRGVLVAAVMALGALAIADRLTGAGSSVSTGSSMAMAHRDAAQIFAEEQALVTSAGDILSTRDDAQAHWRTIEEGLVRARTLELARSSVRRSLLEVLERDAMSPRVQPSSLARETDSDARVHSIVQEVSFDAPSPERAYALLDRLAHMPNVRARVTDLRMEGPGIKNMQHIIKIRVTVETFAYLTEHADG